MASELERLVVRIEADAKQLRDELRRVEGDAARSGRQVEGAFSRVSRSARSAVDGIRGLRSTLVGLGAALAIRETIQAADAWTNYSNRLKNTLGSTEAAAQAQQRLFEIAQRTRTEIEPNITLFNRMALSMNQTKLTTEQTFQVVEGLSSALKVAGATSAEASSALIQLSQAMQSGRLQGDELRTFFETLGPLAKRVADDLGIPFEEFRKKASEGVITSEAFAKALFNVTKVDIAQVGNQARTVSDAMTQLNNSLVKTVGESNNATGATAELVKAIDGLRVVVSSPEFGSGLATIATGIVNIGRVAAEAIAGIVRFENALRESAFAVADFLTKGAKPQSVVAPITFSHRFAEDSSMARMGQTPATSESLDSRAALAAPKDKKKKLTPAERAEKQINEMISDLRDEAEALSVNSAERDKHIALLKAEEFAREGGIKLTAEQRDTLGTLVDSIKAYEQTEFVEELQREADQLGRLGEAARMGEAAFNDTTAAIEAENAVLAEFGTLASDAAQEALKLAQANQDRAKANRQTLAQTETREEIAQLKALADAANRSRVEWDSVSQSFRVNDREARILAKTHQLLARDMGLTEEAARTMAQEFVDADKKLDDINTALQEEAEQMNEAMRDLSNVIATAFEDAVVSGKSFQDVLKALYQDISRIGLRMFFTKPLENMLTQGFAQAKTDQGIDWGNLLFGTKPANNNTPAASTTTPTPAPAPTPAPTTIIPSPASGAFQVPIVSDVVNGVGNLFSGLLDMFGLGGEEDKCCCDPNEGNRTNQLLASITNDQTAAEIPEGSFDFLAQDFGTEMSEFGADFNSALSGFVGQFQGVLSTGAGLFSSVLAQAANAMAVAIATANAGSGGGGGGSSDFLGGIVSQYPGGSQMISGGGSTSSGTTSGGFTGVGAQPYHSGGIVGASGSVPKIVSPSLFSGAPRMHSGGMVGMVPELNDNEVPAILQKGERVLSVADRNRAWGGNTSVNVHIHGVTDMESFRQSKAQVGNALARGVARSGRRYS
jgi:tape measure domain-containing protein